MTVSAQQRALVEGIVSLTGILGLDVIAEGVEAEEERDLAIQVGCAYRQGFLFSRPMPEREIRAWIANRTSPDAGRLADAPTASRSIGAPARSS